MGLWRSHGASAGTGVACVTIKAILTPICGGSGDRAGLDRSIALARKFDAHVDILFARPKPMESFPVVGEGVSSTVVDQLVVSASQEWALRESRAVSLYATVVAEAGIADRDRPPEAVATPAQATIALRREVGREDWVVRRLGPLADLIVLVNQTKGDDDLQFSLSLEAALWDSGRPVLLIPMQGSQGSQGFGRTVCIAWNGSGPASRALAGALPLLTESEAVHVLVAASQRTDPQQGEAVVRYLGWHGIEAVAHRIAANAGRAGPALLTKAESLGCDLFIMGGYGHGRVREMILGGVTRFVIGHASFPVIMAH